MFVALRTQSTTYPMGVYVGNCLAIEQTREKPLDDEVAAAICWWVGRGIEIGIFETDHVKEVRTIEREDATTTPGFRDHFRTEVLFELNANDW